MPHPSRVGALTFGSLELRTNLFLSPLAGYTNLPFRLIAREIGGLDLCTTDLVSVRSLLRRNPVALQLVATCAADAPLAVQLFGAEPVEMRDGAQMLEAMGIAAVDINMGCPVDKIVRTGSGSMLMTCHAQAARVVEAMASAVRIPVTAKMRLGWDAANLTAPDLARALEDAGAAAIFVHGRTRAQGFSGRVDLRAIAAVVRAVDRVPVIGNGDITTPAAAQRMLSETGCAGVSIGRGALYNPWIFRQTAAWLQDGQELPEPGFEERVRVMMRHLERMIAFYGEEKACMLFRKVAPWYARSFGPSVIFRRRVHSFRSGAEFAEIVTEYRAWRRQFLDEHGELLPRYRARALQSSLGDEGEGEVEAMSVIPVPKGPTAIW